MTANKKNKRTNGYQRQRKASDGRPPRAGSNAEWRDPPPVEELRLIPEGKAMSTGRELLFDILSWGRPHDSDTERAFVREYIDVIPGMKHDEFGNRYLRIGDAPIAWSCHVDTVGGYSKSASGGFQKLRFSQSDGIVSLATVKKTFEAYSWRGGKQKSSTYETSAPSGPCLGADDGVGVWIMLEMIRHQRPGLYLFHRGEERGCLGSGHIKAKRRDILDGIQAAVAFDRAGFSDVITFQSSGRTCSDAFAESFASQLNELEPKFSYRPDDTGVYTDTNEYAGFIPECTNLSVGYRSQHGTSETQNVYHAERLLEAMLKFDTAKLVIERDPSVYESKYSRRYYGDGGWSSNSWSSSGGGWNESWSKKKGKKKAASTALMVDDFIALKELAASYPATVANVMLNAGLTADDVLAEIDDAKFEATKAAAAADDPHASQELVLSEANVELREKLLRDLGYDAAMAGIVRSANPYSGVDGICWDEGWELALNESLGEFDDETKEGANV